MESLQTIENCRAKEEIGTEEYCNAERFGGSLFCVNHSMEADKLYKKYKDEDKFVFDYHLSDSSKISKIDTKRLDSIEFYHSELQSFFPRLKECIRMRKKYKELYYPFEGYRDHDKIVYRYEIAERMLSPYYEKWKQIDKEEKEKKKIEKNKVDEFFTKLTPENKDKLKRVVKKIKNRRKNRKDKGDYKQIDMEETIPEIEEENMGIYIPIQTIKEDLETREYVIIKHSLYIWRYVIGKNATNIRYSENMIKITDRAVETIISGPDTVYHLNYINLKCIDRFEKKYNLKNLNKNPFFGGIIFSDSCLTDNLRDYLTNSILFSEDFVNEVVEELISVVKNEKSSCIRLVLSAWLAMCAALVELKSGENIFLFRYKDIVTREEKEKERERKEREEREEKEDKSDNDSKHEDFTTFEEDPLWMDKPLFNRKAYKEKTEKAFMWVWKESTGMRTEVDFTDEIKSFFIYCVDMIGKSSTLFKNKQRNIYMIDARNLICDHLYNMFGEYVPKKIKINIEQRVKKRKNMPINYSLKMKFIDINISKRISQDLIRAFHDLFETLEVSINDKNIKRMIKTWKCYISNYIP